MYLYIEIVDVVANAFVELLDNNGTRDVYYDDLDNYGAMVVEKLNEEEDTRAVYVVSKESQQAIIEDYSEFFEEFEKNGRKGIHLNDSVSSIQLWQKFCSSMSFKVFCAFRSKDVVRALGV